MVSYAEGLAILLIQFIVVLIMKSDGKILGVMSKRKKAK